MLEDDVIAAKGYARAILDFAYQNQDADYLYLSFTRFTSIGKLFRSSDILTWVTYFLTFYEGKPIDWLMQDFAVIKYCSVSQTFCDCVPASCFLLHCVPPGSERTYFAQIYQYLLYHFTSK